MKSKLFASLWILLLTGLSYFIATYTPSYLNSIMLAFIFGITAGNLFKFNDKFSAHYKITGNFALELAIVFLAFGIDYSFILSLGLKSILAIVFVVFFLLVITFYLAKRLNCPDSTGWLIGIGTAICGSSAIAAASPILAKNKEDVGISLAVINLFGALGMITFPFVINLFSLSPEDASFVIGGSLHSVGNVLGAAFSISDEIGQSALTIKMARVALLSPVLLVLLFSFKNSSELPNQRKMIQLPWYLLFFLIISSLVSLVQIPEIIISWSEFLGKLVLTIAMAAIGMNIKLKTLATSGRKGLTFGLIIFGIQIVLLTLFIL